MKRTIWFWLCFIIAIILAIYFSVRIVMTGVGRTPMSYVHNISISSDSNDKNLSAIASAAALAPNTRSYSIDLAQMNERISAVPGVRKSSVRRMPNGNISVYVSMYQAVALWTDGENFFPLSGDGTIVNTPTETRNMANVVFRGPLPSDITEITHIAHNMVGNLDYMEWIENRRWNMHMFNGITVLLPEHDPESAIGTLMSLNNKHKILTKDISVIDMRDNARILVK